MYYCSDFYSCLFPALRVIRRFFGQQVGAVKNRSWASPSVYNMGNYNSFYTVFKHNNRLQKNEIQILYCSFIYCRNRYASYLMLWFWLFKVRPIHIALRRFSYLFGCNWNNRIFALFTYEKLSFCCYFCINSYCRFNTAFDFSLTKGTITSL